MAKQLKLRRGTTSQHSSFTGAEGEVTVDTTKDTLVVHDGSTAGGIPLAKESDVPSAYTHPNHTGEVTSTGDGATVIADNVVDEANLKVSNSPTNGYALTAQSGNTGGLTWADISASPGGSNTHVQYNNSGSFAGSANLTFDGDNLFLADTKELRFGGTDKLTLRTNGSSSYIESDQLLYIGNPSGTTYIAGDGSSTRIGIGSTITTYGNMHVNGTLSASTINLPSSAQSPLVYQWGGHSFYSSSSVGGQPTNLTNSGAGGYGNYVLGYYAGNSLTSGGGNFLFGIRAGQTITTSENTVAIGPYAVRYMTGGGNIGIGYQASIGSNSGSTAAGNIGINCTMSSATSAEYNIGLGSSTLNQLTTGDYNVVLGYAAGSYITSGSDCVYIGQRAGMSAGSYENIGIGKYACYNADGQSNIAMGSYAGAYIDSGTYNICMGHFSGFGSSGTGGGDNNVTMGYYAGAYLKTGNRNIAIGPSALYKSEAGSDNIMLGSQAGRQIGATGSGASANIGIGGHSLEGASTSSNPQYNIGLGRYTMDQITSGTHNIAIGDSANRWISTGEKNIAIGHNAMKNGATTGQQNICIGYDAGDDITTGNHNLILGMAGRSVTYGGGNILIGAGAGDSSSPSGTISGGDNVICLGSNSITDLYCADTSISSSDKRDKTDITDFTHGLKWVEQLKPITYRWDKRAWYNEYNEDGTVKKEVTPDGSKKKARQHIGFLAQDVLAVEQADGFASKKDDMLVVNLNEDDTAYGLKYERLVPVLVNAIKELSAKVKALEAK